MQNRRLVLLSLMFITILSIISGTIAYLNWRTSASQETSVTFTVTSDFSCSANGGDELNSNNITLAPTDCTNSKYAIKREITTNTTLNSSDKIVYMDLWLDIENLDSGLADSENFKWVFTKEENSCNTDNAISYGTFEGLTTEDKVMLLDGKKYEATTDDDTYYLYIWLDKEETSTSTMNQNFEFKLNGFCDGKIAATYKMISENYACDNNAVGDNPVFTYTGECEVVDDGDDNWKVRFLTTGDLVFNQDTNVDVFLVGGGGGGGSDNTEYYGSGGGGGGYCDTQRLIFIEENIVYPITIGAGGEGHIGSAGGTGKKGGTSSAFGFSVDGGNGGEKRSGGSGGSGGGGCGYSYDYHAGAGGSDGANGYSGSHSGGTGSGVTTREFGEAGAELYAGGGGGGNGRGGANADRYGNFGVGGTGGGGNGGNRGKGNDGIANTGGGGGGSSVGLSGGGAGGSGIVIIRNARTIMVSYDNNGGSGCADSVSHSISGTYGPLCIPEREGYYFGGWFTEVDGGVRKLSTDKVDISVFNLYARWYSEVNYNTISANYNCANVYNGNKISYYLNYTGECEVVRENEDDWKIRFLTSGTLTLQTYLSLDVDTFLVGGGGSSGMCSAGGGGGYTRTEKDIKLNNETSYQITIGAGGYQQAGGSTQAFGFTAAGGSSGAYAGYNTGHGGNGGSGGTGAAYYGDAGGQNGANGSGGYPGKGQIEVPGPNGETGNTREFGEEAGILYSTGGSGGGNSDGGANTGDGGSSKHCIPEGGYVTHSGGSGIVIIRNVR